MTADMAATDKLQQTLCIIHYVSPAVIIAYYSLAVTVSVCVLHNLKHPRTSPLTILKWLTFTILFSYMVEACMLLIDTLANHSRFSSTDSNTYVLSNVLIWLFLNGSLVDVKSPVWYPHYGSWLLSFLTEGLLLALEVGRGLPTGAFVNARMIVRACRLLILVVLPALLFFKSSKGEVIIDEESAALLGQTRSSSTNADTVNRSYGSIAAPESQPELEYESERRKKEEEERQRFEKKLQENGSWFRYIAHFSILLPLMWPSKIRLLQLYILGVGLCLLATRTLRVLEPRQLGIVLDRLDLSQSYVPVPELLLFLLYGFLSSSVISPIRRMLWMPVELNMQATLKTAAYNQIMSLSRDFHTEKHSGELFKAIEQGRSITNLLDTVLFQIGPIFIDVVVAFSYLFHVFGPYMALDVAATTVIYLWASTYLISKQVGPQRRSQGYSRKENQLMYDTVGGWSSVSYFNRQDYEKERYSQAVDLATLWERKTDILYYVTSTIQDMINELGLIVAGFIAVYQIAAGTQKVGSFAMLMAYWGRLTGGLSYFAFMQRGIRTTLVNAESMLELFQRKPTVKDGPHQFLFKYGTIHFHNVGFSYDGKKDIISDFTFHATSGQKIALVGETGGGKSTILKLLFRFYDAQRGKILIDDQDIRDVTLHSLRQCIGVVPQDPALFNDSVMENVRYSKLGATDEEVIEACKGAAIHDKILTFTEGYQTKVGENGVRLSGGELQRVAIARVILKNPDIVLLDEATSAVDTETEAHIQGALDRLTKGRTTITIAHRLSTVTSSDVIVVLKEGRIVEQGSPPALLEAKGKFSELWLKQIGINPTPVDEPSADEKSADHSEPPKTSEKESTTRLSGASSSSGKSLRPTAPEFVPQKNFVPRHQRGTAAKEDQSQDDTAHQNGLGSPSANADDGKPQQKRRLPANHRTEVIIADSQGETSHSRQEVADRTGTKKKRLNPAQRRRNNKTDPSGSAPKPSQNDGPSDGPTLDGSAEASAASIQSRRVSAPVGPLSNVTNNQVGGRAQRRRAQHWRHQKRQSSELTPANKPSEGSDAGPGSNGPPPAITVRLPGSIDETTETSTTGANASSVHFPPGR